MEMEKSNIFPMSAQAWHDLQITEKPSVLLNS